MFATAKAATTTGFASAAHGRTPTATASTSSLKPSRWTDASLYASPPKKTNSLLGRASQPALFPVARAAREHFDFQTQPAHYQRQREQRHKHFNPARRRRTQNRWRTGNLHLW